MKRIGLVLVLGAAAAVTSGATAGAGQVVRERIHDEGTFVIEDFCDEPGLSVQVSFVMDMKVHVVPHGSAGLAYFLQHGRRTEVLTNTATGTSLRSVARVIEKDQRITDNGDGTLTIRILATGNAVLYDTDGKAIARNPGQVRFELLIDDGGTPTDTGDDEIIEDLGVVKGSTGRSDDFCEAAVPALR